MNSKNFDQFIYGAENHVVKNKNNPLLLSNFGFSSKSQQDEYGNADKPNHLQ